jgi:hypothetical protein
MAFHDTTTWPGPKKVVNDYIYKSKNFRNVRLTGSITFAEKVRSNSLRDRFKNRLMLQYKHVFDLAHDLRTRMALRKRLPQS